MLSFENDYSCTATPEIIERISEIAQNQYPGYGNDSICESAKAKSAKHAPALTRRFSSW